MDSEKEIDIFMKYAQDKVLVAGYGSLLSQYSRRRYSNIDSLGLSVRVHGWERNWITRSLTEKQTYAGAIPNKHAALSAQIIALEFNDDFEKREQDYRFTKIDLDSIEIIPSLAATHQALLVQLSKIPIYICETLAVVPSTHSFPVNMSYIETCLAGSHELSGSQGVETFFTHTQGWDTGHFNDDRNSHLYPRSTPVKMAPWNIETLLDRAKSQSRRGQ